MSKPHVSIQKLHGHGVNGPFIFGDKPVQTYTPGPVYSDAKKFVFGLREETRTPSGNPHKHGTHIQILEPVTPVP